MRRCVRCIYPSTKPDLAFDQDGVCAACRSFQRRADVDWDERRRAFTALLEQTSNPAAPYDCIVPASGGKDSHWQVLTVLALGARPLVVVCATDMLSDVGRRNIENLKRFADVIEFTPDLEVRKKLVRIGLHEIGDMSYPEHNVIWSGPLRLAVQLGIRLVCWGEDPQLEYGAPPGFREHQELTRRWASEFGGMNGLRLSDLIDRDGLTERELMAFRFPADEDLERVGVASVWMGHYFDWDGWRNAFVAQQYGFETLAFPVEQSLAQYENLDNYVTVLRDWLRFVKFGYTRACDIACNHIRRGRLTRDEGLQLVTRRERYPRTSLGKPIADVLEYFGLTEVEYFRVCERFTNRALFETAASDGSLRYMDDQRTPMLREEESADAVHAA